MGRVRQLDRPGVRIHLAIGEIELAFLWLRGSIGESEPQFPLIFLRFLKTGFCTRDYSCSLT